MILINEWQEVLYREDFWFFYETISQIYDVAYQMNKNYLPIIIIVGFFILAWILGAQNYLNFVTFQAHQQQLDIFIKQYYILSIFIFAGLYILIIALSLPGAAIMTIISGLLFNQIIGTLIAVLSSTIGASILFVSAKMASGNLVKKVGTWMEKMQKGFSENAFSYMLTLRLIPLFPFVIVNLVAALLQIPFRIFFTATIIGIIPGSFIYASMGVALREVINEPNFTLDLMLKPKVLIALTGLGILSLLPILFKKFKRT